MCLRQSTEEIADSLVTKVILENDFWRMNEVFISALGPFEIFKYLTITNLWINHIPTSKIWLLHFNNKKYNKYIYMHVLTTWTIEVFV